MEADESKLASASKLADEKKATPSPAE